MNIRSRDKAVAVIISFLILLGGFEEKAFAVVGNAESFDPVEKRNLDEFHDEQLEEERRRKMLTDEEREAEDLEKETAASKSKAKISPEEANKKMDALLKEKELGIKKRRNRFMPKFGADGKGGSLGSNVKRIFKKERLKFDVNLGYSYDTNNSRLPSGQEGSNAFNSLMNTNLTTLWDLSGKKTDLRLEIGGNPKFTKYDPWRIETRLRYRRKYFKKLTNSANLLLGRDDSKTPEIDSQRTRWDVNAQSAWNWAFSKKLSFNLGTSATKRLFTTEAFDQDSGENYTLSPSLFWNFTPKSRVSIGWSPGGSRSRSKVGDSNSQNFNIGYFGRITRKSSTSINIGFDHQTPKSLETPESNGITVGWGFIWQATPKSQITLQAIRSLQNTTSNITSGDVEGENTTSRSDSHYYNDSITLALNTRLTSKLTTSISANTAWTRNKATANSPTEADSTGTGTATGTTATAEDTESQQIAFPLSISFNYLIRRWLTVTLGYTFTYRTGDEETDKFVSHLFRGNVRISV